MGKYFLAIDYGVEGWSLQECQSPEDALDRVTGGVLCARWKVFKELDVRVIEEKILEDAISPDVDVDVTSFFDLPGTLRVIVRSRVPERAVEVFREKFGDLMMDDPMDQQAGERYGME